jgi:drug/metabolite transporter (DMT)-like permease
MKIISILLIPVWFGIALYLIAVMSDILKGEPLPQWLQFGSIFLLAIGITVLINYLDKQKGDEHIHA